MKDQHTILLFGAGAMGRAIAWDLRRHEPTCRIIAIDRSSEALRALTDFVGCEGLECRLLDADKVDSFLLEMKSADLAVGAAGYHLNLTLARQAIQTGTHWVDLGGNNDVAAQQFALDAEAERAGVAVIPDCGLAPGLVSILAADALERLDVVEELHFRVGGLPQRPKPPLNYQLCFSSQGLINEYVEPSRFIENGDIKTAPSLTGAEEVDFGEPVGRLIAFHTSGGASTLVDTFAGQVLALDYKTLRFPDHLEQVKLLSDLGFFSSDPVEAGEGKWIRPRDLTAALLEKRLGWIKDDMVVLISRVVGLKDNRPTEVLYKLLDKFDPTTGLTAMARTTGFSAATVARMILEGDIAERGVLRQELSIPPSEFLKRLARKGIKIDISEDELK